MPVNTPEARFAAIVAAMSRRLAWLPSLIAWTTRPGSLRAMAANPTDDIRSS